MFPMTVTVNNKIELGAIMAALADTNAYAQAKAIHAEPKAEAPKTDDADLKATKAPKATAAAPTAPAPAPSAAAASTAEFPSEPAPAIAVADVNAAIIGLAKAKGRDAAVALLAEFKVAKVPELKPEQFADVLAAAKKATA